MPAKNRLRIIFVSILFCCCCFLAKSQVRKKRVHRQKIDTTAMFLNSRISDSILQEAEIKDTTIPFMVNRIEAYNFSMNRAENFFDRSVDTTGILKSLTGIERGLNYLHSKLEQSDNPLNLRSLNTTRVLLGESRETLETWEKSLEGYTD